MICSLVPGQLSGFFLHAGRKGKGNNMICIFFQTGVLDGCFSVFVHPEVIPISRVGTVHVAEMWHGPTGSFKDLPVSIISRLADYILRKQGQKATFLVGTAGNTGSATIHGVLESKCISAIVLFPRAVCKSCK